MKTQKLLTVLVVMMALVVLAPQVQAYDPNDPNTVFIENHSAQSGAKYPWVSSVNSGVVNDTWAVSDGDGFAFYVWEGFLYQELKSKYAVGKLTLSADVQYRPGYANQAYDFGLYYDDAGSLVPVVTVSGPVSISSEKIDAVVTVNSGDPAVGKEIVIVLTRAGNNSWYDNVRLAGDVGAPDPFLTATPSAINFVALAVGDSSTNVFSLAGEYLDASPITVGPAANSDYLVSLSETGPFDASLQIIFPSFDPNYNGDTLDATIYVLYSPSVVGSGDSTLPYSGGSVAPGSEVTLTGMGVDGIASLQVDIGLIDEQVQQSGWHGWYFPSTSTGGSETFEYPYATDGTVDVTLSAAAGADLYARAYGIFNIVDADPNLTVPNVWYDSVFANVAGSSITLTLDDLEVGVYDFTSYHFANGLSYQNETLVSVSIDGLDTGLDVYFVTGDSSNLKGADGLLQAAEVEGNGMVSFKFSVVNEGDSVTINYDNTPFGINGFVIEPSTYGCTNPLTGDLDGDCVVGLADFAMLASQWLQCNRDPQSECP
jgi:hypothetical protein